MRKTKVCIIGGGSRQWAIQFFRDLAYNKLTDVAVTLYDIDKKAAVNNIEVAMRTFALNGLEGLLEVRAEEEIDKALDGCDLVIISIEPGITECRRGDLKLPEEYGIYQTVGDTTGPGGIMRARRAVPLFVDFGKAIEKNCPEAWVINYTNPMTLCTAALYQGFPKIKALGCCHEVFNTEKYIASLVSEWFGVEKPNRREIILDISGVNHFTWATGAWWNGVDLMPYLIKKANDSASYIDRSEKAKERKRNEKWFESDHVIALSLLRDFGALGAAGDRHLAEFVPWYAATDEELASYGVTRTPYEWRIRVAEEKKNKVFKDEELVATLSDEEGVDIMRSLLGKRTLKTNINRPNEGQVSYLPKGRIVESNGFISQNSIRPIISKDPPLAVQNLIRRVSDVEQMTLEAIVSDDESLLLAAFLEDPLVNIPRSKAVELFNKMLKACALVY